MEHQETCVEIFEKFTWKIGKFSHWKTVYSEPFVLGGYPWRIRHCPKGGQEDGSLAIHLEAVQMQIEDVSQERSYRLFKDWSRDVKFKLVVFNQLDTNRTITKEYKYEFSERRNSWGENSFMPLVELYDPQKGFFVKDVLIVGVEVFVCKSTHDEPVIQAANLYSASKFGSQTGHMEVEVPRPNPEVQGLKKDSSKDADAEFVSAALGRVLYFLKTRKVKDMNEQACKDLQVLWDQLKKLKFDLTWLEPHVQSALGMKSYVEKSLHVEKLKEDIVLLKEKLAAAEVNLDEEIDLLKAKGFKEIGLDSELGCGSWRS